MLNKNVAAALAIVLGIFGTHQFYIGRWWSGVVQFVFFFFALGLSMGGAEGELLGLLFTLAALVPFLTGVLWAVMPKEKWTEKYDPTYASAPALSAAGGYAVADVGDLKSEGKQYYTSADYDLAAEAFTEAISVDFSDAGSHFNLACSFAQLGRYPEALHHLELSVTLGLPKPQRIEKHPALGALRKLPSFASFRQNNYRRQTHAPLAGPADRTGPEPETREEPVETIQDFTNPPPRPQAGPMDGDLLEQISRLRELHDAGVLTPREYQLQKERLLG